MAHQINNSCVGCGACVSQCPTDSIKPTAAATYRIEAESCISCGACEAACPNSAILPD
ncbi:MAG TPA: 4Fe-4S binding protein [Chthoniobacterales bacterium]